MERLMISWPPTMLMTLLAKAGTVFAALLDGHFRRPGGSRATERYDP
jgi:hypothetical protein